MTSSSPTTPQGAGAEQVPKANRAEEIEAMLNETDGEYGISDFLSDYRKMETLARFWEQNAENIDAKNTELRLELELALRDNRDLSGRIAELSRATK
jgi:hypothetical protein